MGIGADDIFVFTDCWKQSEHELGVSLPRHGRGALAERVFWVWRKASGAMAGASPTLRARSCFALSHMLPTLAPWWPTCTPVRDFRGTVTSCTTFAAFLCTAISPIPTISTFGIMAALITLFNYLLVISWYACRIQTAVATRLDRLCRGVDAPLVPTA